MKLNQTRLKRETCSVGWCKEQDCSGPSELGYKQGNVTCKVGEDCIINLDQCQIAECGEQNDNKEKDEITPDLNWETSSRL